MERPMWISVSDRMPKNFQLVLAFHPKEYPEGMRAYVQNGEWVAEDSMPTLRPAQYGSDPTHWMQLPNPPELG